MDFADYFSIFISIQAPAAEWRHRAGVGPFVALHCHRDDIRLPEGRIVFLRVKRFFEISFFLEGIPTEYIISKNSLESKLQIESICSIRIFARK